MPAWLNEWWRVIVLGGLWLGGVATFLASAWFNSRQAKRDRERIANEAARFEETLKLEREKLLREATLWREERRDTKRAEVAGETLVGLLAYLRELLYMTSSSPKRAAKEGETYEQSFRADIAERWPAFQPHAEAFAKIRAQTAAFLPDDALDLCDRILSLEINIYANQSTASTNLGPHVSGEFWKEGFGDETRAKIKGFEIEARRILRPLALLHDVSVPSDSAAASKSENATPKVPK